MIEIMQESTGAMLAVKATKKLTGEDYTEVWIPALQKTLAEHTKGRCVLYMDENFEGWELKAMWEDAKFGFAHRNDFEKFAVVGGPKWIEWGTKVAGAMMSGEVRTFGIQQIEEALKWAAEHLLSTIDEGKARVGGMRF